MRPLLILLTLVPSITLAARADQRQREAEAEAHLAEVTDRIEALYAAGEVAAADTLTADFAETWSGTWAASESWLRLAAPRRDAGDLDGELSALAAAYSRAQDPAQAEVVLAALAAAYRARWWWDRLDVVLETLLSRYPDSSEIGAYHLLQGEADAARLRLDAAVEAFQRAREAGREPAIARRAEAMLQIIRGLQGATRTDHVGFGTVRRVDLEGRGERHLLLQGDDGLIQVKEDPALTPVRRFTLEEPGAAPGTRLSGLTWVADPDGGSDLVFVKREAPGEPPTLHLMGGDGARLQSLVELPMTGLFPDAVATVDLDGDGDREVYVGLGAYRRRLLRLDPPVTPGGGWTVSNPYPALLVGNSDVVWLRVLDVEQDSRPELLIHAGPWSAYDLRLLGPVEGERRQR